MRGRKILAGNADIRRGIELIGLPKFRGLLHTKRDRKRSVGIVPSFTINALRFQPRIEIAFSGDFPVKQILPKLRMQIFKASERFEGVVDS